MTFKHDGLRKILREQLDDIKAIMEAASVIMDEIYKVCYLPIQYFKLPTI